MRAILFVTVLLGLVMCTQAAPCNSVSCHLREWYDRHCPLESLQCADGRCAAPWSGCGDTLKRGPVDESSQGSHGGSDWPPHNGSQPHGGSGSNSGWPPHNGSQPHGGSGSGSDWPPHNGSQPHGSGSNSGWPPHNGSQPHGGSGSNSGWPPHNGSQPHGGSGSGSDWPPHHGSGSGSDSHGSCPKGDWKCPDGSCVAPATSCNATAAPSTSPTVDMPPPRCPHLRFPCNGGCIPSWTCCNCAHTVVAARQCDATKAMFFCKRTGKCVHGSHKRC